MTTGNSVAKNSKLEKKKNKKYQAHVIEIWLEDTKCGFVLTSRQKVLSNEQNLSRASSDKVYNVAWGL